MFPASLASSRSEAVPSPLGGRLQADGRIGAVGQEQPVTNGGFRVANLLSLRIPVLFSGTAEGAGALLRALRCECRIQFADLLDDEIDECGHSQRQMPSAGIQHIEAVAGTLIFG